MAEELTLGPGSTLEVVSMTDGVLELRATYAGGASPPPAHLHPEQDERFELETGALRTRVGGVDGALAAGEVLEIPRGTAHQMWNEGEETAVFRWLTLPAGRTVEWFREISALRAGQAPVGDPATLLERYSDVYRLADA